MRRSVPLIALVLAAACGGDDVTVPPGSGTLEITTGTTGVEIDPDGYTFRLDNADAQSIGANDTKRSPQSAGSHAVELSGLSPNCSVSGDNPQTIEVTADQTTSVAFAVTCTSTTGTLSVTASTTGDSPDADGYQVTVDGVDQGSLATNASLTLSNIGPGTHLVGLGGIAGNCRVQGDNPQTVTINSGAATPAAFAITCEAPPAQSGTIQVITATTGTNNDPDGYAFSVDGASSQPIGVNGNVSVSNTATGIHAIQLTGVAPNCTVQGTNPRSATVVAGAPVEVRFAIACSATSGSLEIKTSTTGSNPDADGYSVSIEGRPGQAIGANATLTLSNVAPGSHQVTLAGIAPNCTVAGDNPKGVTVTGSSVSVEFSVTCTATATTLQWRPMESGTTSDLSAVWASSPSDVFAGGGSEIFHFNGQQWSEQLRLTSGNVVTAIWGTAPNNVFAVGFDGQGGILLHYDGSNWTPMQGPDLPEATYSSVWGTSGTDVYAVGEFFESHDRLLIAHFDGTRWTQVNSDVFEFMIGSGVHGTASNDIYVVGYLFPQDAYSIAHFDGFSWTRGDFEDPPGTLQDVWADAPNNVFAVGGSNTGPLIQHNDGSTWSIMDAPAVGGLNAIWGASATDIYAVGARGILHYDGAAWSKVSEQGGTNIWGLSSTDVYVVGSNGIILHGTP